jgi:hypothetical protein
LKTKIFFYILSLNKFDDLIFKMIFEEAVKPKLRISIDVNEEIIDSEEQRGLNDKPNQKSGYGWSLEPPKLTR